jgi:hypothetical protein
MSDEPRYTITGASPAHVLALGPADELRRDHGYVQISVHQCGICSALVVEDFMPNHLAWHRSPESVRS